MWRHTNLDEDVLPVVLVALFCGGDDHYIPGCFVLEVVANRSMAFADAHTSCEDAAVMHFLDCYLLVWLQLECQALLLLKLFCFSFVLSVLSTTMPVTVSHDLQTACVGVESALGSFELQSLARVAVDLLFEPSKPMVFLSASILTTERIVSETGSFGSSLPVRIVVGFLHRYSTPLISLSTSPIISSQNHLSTSGKARSFKSSSSTSCHHK